MKTYLYVFFISMVPVIELRGAIPFGCATGLPWYTNFLLCIVGNLLPVPFILFLIEWALGIMKKIKYVDRFAYWLEEKAEKNKEKITKYATFGLLLFVGIPLPGTGAWTGSLVASMLEVPPKKAFPPIAVGVVGAAMIVTVLYYFFHDLFVMFVG